MSKSNFKPSRKELINNLDQYRFTQNGLMSDLEFDVLSSICINADHAIRIVSKTAVEQVPLALKTTLLPHLSTDPIPMPMATMVGDRDAFRISIPISFIHRLLAIAPTRGGTQPNTESDYFCQSVLVAVLAAYAHELTHVFIGHLATKSSSAQETNADFLGGGITWRWLQRTDIQKICKIRPVEMESACVFGFLHLLSILNDTDQDQSIYLPRAARLQFYGGGAAFSAEQTLGVTYGDSMQRAMMDLPKCPDPDYHSSNIEGAFHYLVSQTTLEVKGKVASAFDMIKEEKRHWYDASVHLRPIKKALQKIAKRYFRSRS